MQNEPFNSKNVEFDPFLANYLGTWPTNHFAYFAIVKTCGILHRRFFFCTFRRNCTIQMSLEWITCGQQACHICRRNEVWKKRRRKILKITFINEKKANIHSNKCFYIIKGYFTMWK